MMHPIALQAVVEVRQRDVLEGTKLQRRAAVAFDDQARVQQTQAPLAHCGQTRRMNSLAKGNLS